MKHREIASTFAKHFLLINIKFFVHCDVNRGFSQHFYFILFCLRDEVFDSKKKSFFFSRICEGSDAAKKNRFLYFSRASAEWRVYNFLSCVVSLVKVAE
jgi:hypothetical protein